MKVHERRSYNVLLVGPWSATWPWVVLREKGVSVEWVGLFSSCWTDSLCEDGQHFLNNQFFTDEVREQTVSGQMKTTPSLFLVWGCQLWSSFISCSHENNNCRLHINSIKWSQAASGSSDWPTVLSLCFCPILTSVFIVLSELHWGNTEAWTTKTLQHVQEIFLRSSSA